MSILSMLQDVCNEVGLTPPTAAVNGGQQERQLLAIAYRVADDLREAYDWPQLTRLATITLVTNQANYALPADICSAHLETFWSSGKQWPLFGPMSAQEWMQIKYGIGATAAITQRFRFKGYSNKQMFIDPTPDASYNGKLIVFEYQSLNTVRPVEWTTGTAFAAKTYCFNDGDYFYTATAGTTGATAPTAAAPNDGGINWTVFTGVYNRFLADTDVTQFDEQMLGLGVQWNYLASKSLPYLHLEKKYNQIVPAKWVDQAGARSVSLVPRRKSILMGPWNIPDTGYGGI